MLVKLIKVFLFFFYIFSLVSQLVNWSLASLFGTNMAISETNFILLYRCIVSTIMANKDEFIENLYSPGKPATTT